MASELRIVGNAHVFSFRKISIIGNVYNAYNFKIKLHFGFVLPLVLGRDVNRAEMVNERVYSHCPAVWSGAEGMSDVHITEDADQLT